VNRRRFLRRMASGRERERRRERESRGDIKWGCCWDQN